MLDIPAAQALRAADCKKRFAVYGLFYEIPLDGEVWPCRSVLELVAHDLVPAGDPSPLLDRQPDLLVVMMNPGKSRPIPRNFTPPRLAGPAESGSVRRLVPTVPDRAQYQLMKVMAARGWRHARVLNLSDLRESKSEVLFRHLQRLDAAGQGEAHCIFSPLRRPELLRLIGPAEASPLVLLGWGSHQAIQLLAERCLEALGSRSMVGVQAPGGPLSYVYPSHPLQSEKDAWIARILGLLNEAGFLMRYRNGEHVQVWSELQALGHGVRMGAHLDQARAVARETMLRVKSNLETLRERWNAKGFTFGYAWAGEWAQAEAERAPPLLGQPTAAAVLDAFENVRGVLPVSLRAFYELIGCINFIGVSPPGDARWPGREELDPLQIEPLHLAAEPSRLELEDSLILFPDPLLKFFLGGVGPIWTPLPAPTADAQMWFEGELLDQEGEAWRLVPYLRETILERGGMAPLSGTELDEELVGELTDGLMRF